MCVRLSESLDQRTCASESLSLTLLALPSAYSTVVSRNPLLDLTEIGLAGAEDSPHPGKGEEPMGRPRRDQSIHEVSSWGKERSSFGNVKNYVHPLREHCKGNLWFMHLRET